MSQPTATCENCRFWKELRSGDTASSVSYGNSPSKEYHVPWKSGTCHRSAPVWSDYRSGNTNRPRASWLETGPHDCCGEHQTPESVESIDEFVRRTRQPAPDAQTPVPDKTRL